MVEPRPNLSIVIPTYNGWNVLSRCLASVERYRPTDAEVIVVDDASRDGTADRLKAWPGIRVVATKTNLGFCGAANAGIKASQGRFVELLNNDAVVTQGWAEAALANFDDPAIGSIAPLVCRLPFRRRIDSAGDLYFWFGNARKRGEGQFRSPTFDHPEEVFSASASSAFYRRAALERVGGFPEHFGAYLDDVDLGFRLRLAGYRCLYEPRCVVYHWVSASHPIRSRRLKAQVSRNTERVFWANVSSRALLAQAAPHAAYILLQLAQKAVRGEFGPWFAGKCALLTEMGALWRNRRTAQMLSLHQSAGDD